MAANDCRTVRSRQVRQRGALLADCRLSWHHFSGRLNDCCCAKLSVRFRFPFCFWEQANISASNQALMLLGKELGMFSDRMDVQVSAHNTMSDAELRQFVVNKYKKLGLDLSNPYPDGKSDRNCSTVGTVVLT